MTARPFPTTARPFPTSVNTFPTIFLQFLTGFLGFLTGRTYLQMGINLPTPTSKPQNIIYNTYLNKPISENLSKRGFLQPFFTTENLKNFTKMDN
jgi:hypothetical protein